MKKALSPDPSRRGLLKGLGFCAAASACNSLILRPALAARAPAATLMSEALSPSLLWIRGAGANLLALKDARGLTFVDGGLAAHAGDVLKLARAQLGAGDPHTLINTHWHPEHVGLNETLGKAGARIIAHENTKLWLGTTVERELDKVFVPPLPPKARPNATTYTEDEFAVGDEVVHYGYLPQAHTDGDLYVHLRKANVLVTGGVLAGRGWSIVDYLTGGWINGLVAGQRSLLQACNSETRIVSCYGDRVLTRKDLEDERAMLAKLSEQLGKMLRSGFGPADVLAAAPAKEFEPRYGDATEFLMQSFKSLWGHMAPDA
jgi:cyclase